jgi:hypothetical protein
VVTLLAGWAHQPAQSVLHPARNNRPGPVVGLPGRDRIRESRPAPGHVAPGSREADLITNDTVPGDRNRMSQRIEPHGRLRGSTVTVRPRAADGPQAATQPAQWATPSRLACLGTLPELTGPPASHGATCAQHSRRGSPGSGEPPGLSRERAGNPLAAERRTAPVRYTPGAGEVTTVTTLLDVLIGPVRP